MVQSFEKLDDNCLSVPYDHFFHHVLLRKYFCVANLKSKDLNSLFELMKDESFSAQSIMDFIKLGRLTKRKSSTLSITINVVHHLFCFTSNRLCFPAFDTCHQPVQTTTTSSVRL